jgi:hypothetical protein
MAPKLIDLQLDEAIVDVQHVEPVAVEITDSLNNRYTFVTFYATAMAFLLENHLDAKAACQTVA